MIDEKYLYKKVYDYDRYLFNIHLKNPGIAKQYIDDKLNLLITNINNSEKQRQIKLNIYKEIFEIFDYDMKNEVLPEPIGYFENEEEKIEVRRKKIMTDDFYCILGNIFSNFHTYIFRNNLKYFHFEIHGLIINYKEIYETALNDYKLKLLNNENNSYIAVFAFPALIEFLLYIKLNSYLIQDSCHKLLEKINKEDIKLTNEENKLFNSFLPKGNKIFNTNKDLTLKRLYEMFVKYNIIEEDEENEWIIVGKIRNNTITLGRMIKLNYTKSIVKEEYIKLLEILLLPENLNLRNNIMHINNINFDYTSICFSSIFLQLIYDIYNNECFTEEVLENIKRL